MNTFWDGFEKQSSLKRQLIRHRGKLLGGAGLTIGAVGGHKKGKQQGIRSGIGAGYHIAESSANKRGYNLPSMEYSVGGRKKLYVASQHKGAYNKALEKALEKHK